MAQELVFSSLNELQLPSQECYKIQQDREGYIWFSTDNGLCRYGNGSLKVFDKQNGLPEASVYNMTEDPTGTMWFMTSENRVIYFDGQKLVEAAFNKQYNKAAIGRSAHPVPLMLDMSDPENSLVANSYYACRINRKTNTVFLLPKPGAGISLQLIKMKGHPLLPNSFQLTDNKYFQLDVKTDTREKKILATELPVANPIKWNTPTVFSGDIDFMGIQNYLLKLNTDLSHSFLPFPGRVLSLYIDKANGLWVGVLNDGLYYYPDIRTMKPAHHSLKGFSVTGICEDTEGGLWCSTLEKGVFYCRNKHLVSYNSIEGLNKRMSLLKYTKGSVFASSSGEALFQCTAQRYMIHSLPFATMSFSDILPQKDNWLLAGSDMTIRMDQKFSFGEKLVQPPVYNNGCNELAPGSNNSIYGVFRKIIMKIDETGFIELVYYSAGFTAKTIVHKSGNLFLLGGDQGLYEFDVLSHESRKVNGVPDKVKKIIKSRAGEIWVATKNDGIYRISGKKISNITQKMQVKAQVFYDLTEDAAGNIWAGSNYGLFCFFVKDGRDGMMHYSSSQGLPSNEVYKVAADSSNIWFSTYEGLFRLPVTDNAVNTTGPAIHLQQPDNETTTDSPHRLQLPYDHNNFRFTFDILTFKNGRQTKMEYRLEKDGQSTVTTVDGNELLLENLDAGTYRLSVYGLNNSGIKSPQPEVFEITINAPFWKTWWFILLASVLVLLLIFLVTRSIIRSIRKKEEAKTKVNKLMADYQITALQAQMNPHFIFNAINTIQGYILEKNEEEAYNYLSKFGKLIRNVLHHSQQRLLLLDQELEVMNLYIELEQLRFDNCFDYELHLSERVTAESIQLPGMILQPYIENAIWHGIVNLRDSRRGKLKISMERENEVLVVTIEDNGIGRDMASGFNKDRRHKSVSMQLTKERLSAINQFYGHEMASVTITDLFDEQAQPAGTRVEVRIPINTEV